MHGRGIKTLAAGCHYDGEWQDGLAHGHGARTFANGDRHEGHYRNDMRNGYGVYSWACGDRYVGEWQDGRMHGSVRDLSLLLLLLCVADLDWKTRTCAGLNHVMLGNKGVGKWGYLRWGMEGGSGPRHGCQNFQHG